MERKEQIKRMRQRIIDSAIQEFNEYGYEQASLNHVCKLGNISKGIIYHYFNDKDDLYLACLKELYDTLLGFYHVHLKLDSTIEIKEYMSVRLDFFKAYPMFVGLFFYSLLYTPEHLKEQTKAIMQNVKNYNILVYKEYLKKLHLRVKQEEAIMYLDACQSAYNEYFRKRFIDHSDWRTFIDEHEKRIPEWIDMMLYGIASEREERK